MLITATWQLVTRVEYERLYVAQGEWSSTVSAARLDACKCKQSFSLELKVFFKDCHLNMVMTPMVVLPICTQHLSQKGF